MKRNLKLIIPALLIGAFSFGVSSCGKKEGCTDNEALNYDADAEEDDGSCEYPAIEGCTDSTATNYNAEATVDDGSCEYAPELPCDEGVEFCMDFGGTEHSGDVTVNNYTGTQHRIYWENGTGTSFEQVELDVFATDAGTYDIASSGADGTSSFEYWHATNGVKEATSGSVEITTFDFGGDGLTGTFDVTLDDGTVVTGGFYEAK